MKFVHIADIHFDKPFTSLNGNISKQRHLEQRIIFKEVINYIKNNKIKYLFISGDFYEHEYIKQSTIDYINSLFKTIPSTKIYITPGNHDPLLKNSFYNNFIWSDNVHVFNSDIEKIEEEGVNIYGYGFSNFYYKSNQLDNFKIDEKDKANILITHGALDSGKTEDMEYNPISSKLLKNIDFDYVALGHVHTTNYSNLNKQIIYSGSLMAMGFDEIGEHGMIVGQIENKKLNLEFIKLDKREFKELNFNITNIDSEEELIEKVQSLNLEEDYFYKINLTGKRKFEINIDNIFKLIENDQILKIKNLSKLNIDLEAVSKQKNLKGFFVQECLKEINKNKLDDKEIIYKAMEMGIDAFEN